MIPKNAYILSGFQEIFGRLEKLGLTSVPNEGGVEELDSTLRILKDIVPVLEKECEGLELIRTHSRLVRLNNFLKTDVKHPLASRTFSAELKAMKDALEDDLKKCVVFFPTEEQVKYYENQKLFGDKVFDNFISIRKEVVAAGNCYATDNFTACVFHLMRITEGALRILAKHLQVEELLKREIDYEDWKKIADAIDARLVALRNTTRSTERQIEIDFYADATNQCQHFKELWRDNIMHSRKSHNGPEALGIMFRVSEFMKLLSQRIAEEQ